MAARSRRKPPSDSAVDISGRATHAVGARRTLSGRRTWGGRRTRMATTWRPDPSFYPSPRLAMQAPPEQLAYVVTLNPNADGRPDALCVLDVDSKSSSYGQIVGRVDMPNAGDELHHFGWNACSATLCPYAPHPHVERRFLLVPGLRSSRIHVIDTKPDPRQPRIVRVIEPEEVMSRAGYSR